MGRGTGLPCKRVLVLAVIGDQKILLIGEHVLFCVRDFVVILIGIIQRLLFQLDSKKAC